MPIHDRVETVEACKALLDPSERAAFVLQVEQLHDTAWDSPYIHDGDDALSILKYLQGKAAGMGAAGIGAAGPGAGGTGAGGAVGGPRGVDWTEDERSWRREMQERTRNKNSKIQTAERFEQAMKPHESAPTSFHELEAMLSEAQGGLILVTEAFFTEVEQYAAAKKFLFTGSGAVVDHMTAHLRSLMRMQAGSSEQDTAVGTGGPLFKLLYAFLDKELSGALGAEIHLNASTMKCAESTLSSPIQGLERPHVVVMSKRKVSLFVVEEKPQGKLSVAADDLREYLAGGLPVGYQRIPAIPVAAVAGCDIKFGLCDVNGTVTLMSNAIQINTANGAIQALAASLNVYRLMCFLNDLAPQELMEMGLGGQLERGDGCTVQTGSRNNGITKMIKDIGSFEQKYGANPEKIEAAYGVDSPFLPKIKEADGQSSRAFEITQVGNHVPLADADVRSEAQHD